MARKTLLDATNFGQAEETGREMRSVANRTRSLIITILLMLLAIHPLFAIHPRPFRLDSILVKLPLIAG